MEIVYIANEGFLIKASNRKVLVDALFGGFEADWCDVPSGEMVERMEKGLAPFDHIDLILVTHAHIDHFNAGIVARHLAGNGSGIVVCPQQAVRELAKVEGYEKISSRVREVVPEDGMDVLEMEVWGMRVEVWQLAHSPYYVENKETGEKVNRHAQVQNLGFVVGIDHKRIFHGGDWASAGFPGQATPLEGNLDLAFLNVEAYFKVYLPLCRQRPDLARPGEIVLMHMNPAGDPGVPADGSGSALQGVTIFRSPLESRQFGD